MCEYCENENAFKKQIAKFLKAENYEFPEVLDISFLKEDFNEKARTISSNLKNQNISNDARENLNAKLASFKTILETLRDYEVRFKLIELKCFKNASKIGLTLS